MEIKTKVTFRVSSILFNLSCDDGFTEEDVLALWNSLKSISETPGGINDLMNGVILTYRGKNIMAIPDLR